MTRRNPGPDRHAGGCPQRAIERDVSSGPGWRTNGGIAGTEDLPADWLGVREAMGEGDGESDDESGDESYDEEMTDDGQWSEESESSDDSGEGE